MKRVVLRGILIAFLLVTGVLGVQNFFSEVEGAETAGQLAVQICDLLFGTIGIFAAFGLWKRKGWTLSLMWIWALIIPIAASLAITAYGGANVLAGVAAGASTLIVVAPVVILVRRNMKPNSVNATLTEDTSQL